jgi:hypothetical protein
VRRLYLSIWIPEEQMEWLWFQLILAPNPRPQKSVLHAESDYSNANTTIWGGTLIAVFKSYGVKRNSGI